MACQKPCAYYKKKLIKVMPPILPPIVSLNHGNLTYLSSARRIVVKVGSALLVNDNGTLRDQWLNGLAQDLARLKHLGYDIVIVSSGAIALGRGMIVAPDARLSLAEKRQQQLSDRSD